MWVKNKVVSAKYCLQGYMYRRSPRWAEHPLNPKNLQLQEEDWQRVDRELQGLSPVLGFEICDYQVPKDEYIEFKARCNVSRLYAVGCRDKKILEHFIAFKLLNLQPNDLYLDVASEMSPLPKIFRKRFGVNSFSQDISYKPGVHGRRIGSSADAIPLRDETVDKVSPQCAFEHFEGEIDSNFVHELSRILKKGGQCLIIPLYLSCNYLNIIDPIFDYGRIRFDEGATVVAETDLGGVFERVYSPGALRRILTKNSGFEQRIYRIGGLEKITEEPSAFRIRWALSLRKIELSRSAE